MKIVLLGVQGCGKGTQAKNLNEMLNIPHISTGDIFRGAFSRNTELGTLAKQYMDRGDLVPDEITCGLVSERINEEDCKNGFILDGFPRNLNQGKALSNITNIDLVIYFNLDPKIAYERLVQRVTCTKCGNPCMPGVTECPKCGGPVVHRDDDKPEAIKKRIDIFLKDTLPLADYYNELGIVRKLDSSGSVEQTTKNLKKLLGEFCD